jgi:hypothetical protein
MADGSQPVCNIENDVVIDVLEPQLNAGNVTAIEGGCESIGKRRQFIAVNVRRRYQVEPAAKPVVFICHSAQNLP